MTKTDELISKLEDINDSIRTINNDSFITLDTRISEINRLTANLSSKISSLKEQIKKEENINDFTIPYLKSEYNQQLERITKIIGKKPDVFEQGINALLYIIENKVNPDVMPYTCRGKYKEVIGFDVIDRHNKKCFDDTLENIKKSMKEEQLLKSAEEILDKYGCPEIPFDENITMFYPAIIEAMEEYASHPIKDITDEEIEKEFPINLRNLCKSLHIPENLMSAEMGDALKSIQEGNLNKQIGAKWMRSKMKSNGKI